MGFETEAGRVIGTAEKKTSIMGQGQLAGGVRELARRPISGLSGKYSGSLRENSLVGDLRERMPKLKRSPKKYTTGAVEYPVEGDHSERPIIKVSADGSDDVPRERRTNPDAKQGKPVEPAKGAGGAMEPPEGAPPASEPYDSGNPEDHIYEILNRYEKQEGLISFAINRAREQLITAEGISGQELAGFAVSYVGYRNQGSRKIMAKHDELVSWGIGDTFGFAFSDLHVRDMENTERVLSQAEKGNYTGLIKFFETEGTRMLHEGRDIERLRRYGEMYLTLAATLPGHGDPLPRPGNALEDPRIQEEWEK